MNCRLRPREDNFDNRLEILKPGEARILLVFLVRPCKCKVIIFIDNGIQKMFGKMLINESLAALIFFCLLYYMPTIASGNIT